MDSIEYRKITTKQQNQILNKKGNIFDRGDLSWLNFVSLFIFFFTLDDIYQNKDLYQCPSSNCRVDKNFKLTLRKIL